MPPSRIPRYTLEYGSYYLRSPSRAPHGKMSDDILLMCDQVAFAFVVADRAMLKHGRLDDVTEWWKQNRDAASPLFGEIQVMVLPLKFPVDLINHVLDFMNVTCIFEQIDREAHELLVKPAEEPSRDDPTEEDLAEIFGD